MGGRSFWPVVLVLLILGMPGCRSARQANRSVDPERLVNIAELFESQGELQLASNMYQEVLRSNPGHGDAARRIQEIAIALGQDVGPTPVEPEVQLANSEVGKAERLTTESPTEIGAPSEAVDRETVSAVQDTNAGPLAVDAHQATLKVSAQATEVRRKPAHDIAVQIEHPVRGSIPTTVPEPVPATASSDTVHSQLESGAPSRVTLELQQTQDNRADTTKQLSADLPVIVPPVQVMVGTPQSPVEQPVVGVELNSVAASSIVRQLDDRRGQMVKFRLQTRTNDSGALPYREHQLDVVEDSAGRVTFRDSFRSAPAQPTSNIGSHRDNAAEIQTGEIQTGAAKQGSENQVTPARQVPAAEPMEIEHFVAVEPSRVDVLVSQLRTGDPSSRVMAGFELGELDATARSALPALMDAMTAETNPMVGILLAETAAKLSMGDERALRVLSSALKQSNPYVRELAVLAISDVITYLADAGGQKQQGVPNEVWERFVGDVSTGIRDAMYQESRPVREAARQAGFWIGIQEPVWVTP